MKDNSPRGNLINRYPRLFHVAEFSKCFCSLFKTVFCFIALFDIGFILMFSKMLLRDLSKSPSPYHATVISARIGIPIKVIARPRPREIPVTKNMK